MNAGDSEAVFDKPDQTRSMPLMRRASTICSDTSFRNLWQSRGHSGGVRLAHRWWWCFGAPYRC